MGQEWRSSKEGIGNMVMYQYTLATLHTRRYGILEMLLRFGWLVDDNDM
jgi:hypothetical protein